MVNLDAVVEPGRRQQQPGHQLGGGGSVERDRPAADRAASYGLDPVVVDGNDVEAVYEVAQAAIGRARDGGGPALIEAITAPSASRTGAATAVRPSSSSSTAVA